MQRGEKRVRYKGSGRVRWRVEWIGHVCEQSCCGYVIEALLPFLSFFFFFGKGGGKVWKSLRNFSGLEDLAAVMTDVFCG